MGITVPVFPPPKEVLRPPPRPRGELPQEEVRPLQLPPPEEEAQVSPRVQVARSTLLMVHRRRLQKKIGRALMAFSTFACARGVPFSTPLSQGSPSRPCEGKGRAWAFWVILHLRPFPNPFRHETRKLKILPL